MRGEVTLVLL